MDTKDKYGFEITTRDRLLRAWENSMELARDFEIYSDEAKGNKTAAQAFSECAAEEGLHAARFLAMLQAEGGK